MSLSHECVGEFRGQEIVLSAAYGNRFQSVVLKLYVGSVCVDQKTVSSFDMAEHKLRGKLKLSPTQQVNITGSLTTKWFQAPT